MIRKLLISFLVIMAATASVATCGLSLANRVRQIGDPSLITTRYAVMVDASGHIVCINTRWRGPWRRLSAEPTTPASICGLGPTRRCVSFGEAFSIGRVLVYVDTRDTIQGLTDCSWTPRHATPKWEADACTVTLIARRGDLQRQLGTIALLAAMYTSVAFVRGPLRRLRRRRRGLCLTCGYNLTGNTSGRCPECGTLLERV